MSAPVVRVRPDAGVGEAARVMQERGLAWLAVVEPDRDGSERLVGVLGRSDLLSVFLRHDDELRAEVLDQVLRRIMLVDPAHVDVQVSNGVVTVAGDMRSRSDAELAVRFIERLEGVVAVEDHLTCEVDDGDRHPRVTRSS